MIPMAGPGSHRGGGIESAKIVKATVRPKARSNLHLRWLAMTENREVYPQESTPSKIAILDEQHQHFHSLIEKLDAHLAHGHDELAAETILQALVTYTIHHFSDEEDLMESYRFPGLASHRIAHNALTMRIAVAAEEHSAGEKGVLASLACYLHTWFELHTLIADKEWAAFLNPNTVTMSRRKGA